MASRMNEWENTMRAWLKKLIAATGLMAYGLVATIAQPPAGKCHILLFDVSGSMRIDNRYGNNLKNWLVEPILKSSAFGPNDRVIVRWFDQRGNTNFERGDRQRTYDNRNDTQAILAHVPANDDAQGLNTDLPEALDLTLGDISNLPVQGDALIWLVTDNDLDPDGLRDAEKMYQKISSDKNFRAAYLFPLAKENGQSVTQTNKAAMVLYLLGYSPKNSPLNLDSLADEVGRRINNQPVTWFPFEKNVLVDDANVTVNEQPASVVDNKLLLPDVEEGTPPEFVIKLRFKSQLRGREIRSGKLTRPAASAQLPESVEAEADLSAWHATISPSTLAIKPKQKSSSEYTALVAAEGVGLHPASFWDAVWNSASDPVDVSLQFTITDLDVPLDESLLAPVKNLTGLQQVVRHSQNSNRPVIIPMSFRVMYNTLWRRVVVALLGLLLLGLVAGGLSVVLVKTRYELTTPSGERILDLPLWGSRIITLDHGERAAVIRKQFGKLEVAPLPTYLINGGHKAARLTEEVNRFEIQTETDGKRYLHSLKRLTRQTKGPALPRDDILD